MVRHERGGHADGAGTREVTSAFMTRLRLHAAQALSIPYVPAATQPGARPAPAGSEPTEVVTRTRMRCRAGGRGAEACWTR